MIYECARCTINTLKGCIQHINHNMLTKVDKMNIKYVFNYKISATSLVLKKKSDVAQKVYLSMF